MTVIPVRVPGHPYRIVIGRGLLRSAGARIRRATGAQALHVVTSPPLRRRFGAAFTRSCRRASCSVTWHLVPDGERAKTLAVAGTLLRGLARAGAGRDAVVVALGGGTVGDVGGLVAALYARGVRVIQVPTTLEAQVDAAIGGKTAVDLPEGKNLAGAFHQPSLVLADPDVLRTLSPRQRRAGLAEVVKYGVIDSAALFRWMERHAPALRRGEAGALDHVVAASARIKARVVAGDEREGGRRMILNFGHTLGHGLEAAGGYRRLLHGEGVAIGMVAAARLSHALGLCAAAVPRRIEALLGNLGLPAAAPRWARRGPVRSAMRLDKKARAGSLRLVLTRSIGDVTVKAGFQPDQLLAMLGVRR